ncbi:MAG: hypothetical protein LBK27_07215 [Treponema sp.]|jgi:hypothetical protein|nr:hypothetical protein [Treponema sp.]
MIKHSVFCAILCLLFMGGNVMAEEPAAAAEPAVPAEVAAPAETPAAAEEPAAQTGRPFIVYHEGLSASWLTRIIKQTGRSNFVYEDFLAGLYFGMALTNVKYVTPAIRLTAYYPLRSTFNKYPQASKTPLHYGADFFGGAAFQIDQLEYVRISLTPGLHLFFLNSDRWNYLNLGIAGRAGVELPLTRGWTILINGIASLDNGNLGGNWRMEPFDVAYQYQVDFGVRYSRKLSNAVPWIKPRKKTPPPETKTEPESGPEEESDPFLIFMR